jgi:hypothetical protein
LLTKRTPGEDAIWAMLGVSGGIMDNPIPNPQTQPWVEHRCSGSNFLFALGVVVLICGAAITGRHEATMAGLGLIIFSSLCDW